MYVIKTWLAFTLLIPTAYSLNEVLFRGMCSVVEVTHREFELYVIDFIFN